MALPVAAGWLVSMAWPIAKQVLVALGIGTISYVGLSALAGQAQAAVLDAWGQLGGSVLQLATLGGIPQSIGIILGAINARLAFLVVGRLGKLS
jgi:hypothetical protein